MSVGMRTAEVYLILAEAKARLKDIPGAVQTLNQLREKRIKGSRSCIAGTCYRTCDGAGNH